MTAMKCVDGQLVPLNDAEAADLTTSPEADRLQRWTAVKAERDRRKLCGGFPVATAAGTTWFHSDTFSRTQLLGLLLLGAQLPPTPWKTMDGQFVTMTPALAAQLFQAAARQDAEVFAAAETHRLAIDASAEPHAYDFSGGWPAIHLETTS